MRELRVLLTLSFLLLFGAITVHAQKSTKGNWSEMEKEVLVDELMAARENFETFLDSANVDVLILCLADKIEEEFEDLDDMDGNSNDVEKMTFNCLEEMGLLSSEEVDGAISEKGNWSEYDRSLAYENLEYTREIMSQLVDSTQIDALFDCVVGKMEMTYANLIDASNDGENLSLLTNQCLQELNLLENTSSSTKGNWGPSDKAALEEQLEYLRADLEQRSGKENTEIVFNCIREKFEHSFDNYQEINNHPEIYRGILDECYGLVKE